MLLIMVIFYGVKNFGIPKIYLFLEILPLISLIINFRIAFGTSNLWNLTHSSFEKLDERK
ncbi:MAG: hypothetical protein U9N34_02490 [Candidatus Cloacimonadota bacterium]|nr:hypothetical protein [Candidatus Cloacimonadota bacterium]